jgi:hypothetical protein
MDQSSPRGSRPKVRHLQDLFGARGVAVHACGALGPGGSRTLPAGSNPRGQRRPLGHRCRSRFEGQARRLRYPIDSGPNFVHPWADPGRQRGEIS